MKSKEDLAAIKENIQKVYNNLVFENLVVNRFSKKTMILTISFNDWIKKYGLYLTGKMAGLNKQSLLTLANILLNAKVTLNSLEEQEFYNLACANLNQDLTLETQKHIK